MKTVIYNQYGPSEVLPLVDLPIPVPKPDEELIKTYATFIESSCFNPVFLITTVLKHLGFKPRTH